VTALLAVALLALSVLAADARPECLNRTAARKAWPHAHLYHVVRGNRQCWSAYRAKPAPRLAEPVPPPPVEVLTLPAALPLAAAPAALEPPPERVEPPLAATATELAALAAGLERVAAQRALTLLAMDNPKDTVTATQFRADPGWGDWLGALGGMLAALLTGTMLLIYLYVRVQPGRSI
jgi:hypothetical protein